MSAGGDEPKGRSSNDISRSFGEARKTFATLHRIAAERANFAQQRARIYRRLANEAGVLERFFNDDNVSNLEGAGESQFLRYALASGSSFGASGNEMQARAKAGQKDEERALWDVASLQSAVGAAHVFTASAGERHGLSVPTPLDLSVERGVDGSVEARVRELLGRVSAALADQHAEAWRLFREGTASGTKSGQKTLAALGIRLRSGGNLFGVPLQRDQGTLATYAGPGSNPAQTRDARMGPSDMSSSSSAH